LITLIATVITAAATVLAAVIATRRIGPAGEIPITVYPGGSAERP
jgi:hypothetical protein